MSFQGSDAFSRRKKRAYRPMAEMNMTPFIDVMTVLLIVFMVAAPMMTVGINVDLPETQAQQLTSNDQPIIITISADQRLYLQETEVSEAELLTRLGALTEGETARKVFLRGDRALAYGRMIKVMGMLSQSGYTRLGLVAQEPE